MRMPFSFTAKAHHLPHQSSAHPIIGGYWDAKQNGDFAQKDRYARLFDIDA
jgi:hypothetical protein